MKTLNVNLLEEILNELLKLKKIDGIYEYVEIELSKNNFTIIFRDKLLNFKKLVIPSSDFDKIVRKYKQELNKVKQEILI